MGDIVSEELYSIRMRAAEGGPHEQGGFHISGGETLTSKQKVAETARTLVQKALKHSRGDADFIQVVIEKVSADNHMPITPLPVLSVAAKNREEGRLRAAEYLRSFGVSEQAIISGMQLLQDHTNLRGAAILSASTGKRLDDRGERGVRVTRMGWSQEAYNSWCAAHPHVSSSRITEALVLATKVAHAPFVQAELCWSDDPEYVTGYVACREMGYVRINPLKERGDFSGGRIFFVQDDVNLDQCISFLEQRIVMLV
ncbi:6-carboxyhexanoate--CoA ligase [Neobacillus sp. DY30]|uniref:6-carboxyhexanoate--CoA ligase n=1 Tax=Neobacillus sp. DY30 TaxID=3047871 RepID=UPI0024C04529|nr:6-carboxyhexanoate--CoA ligase [Neobacillus sp. DY30]WHY00912.1 6-carboxyhexanoate--CoA ligase [Neobacillus sp. DY30]